MYKFLKKVFRLVLPILLTSLLEKYDNGKVRAVKKVAKKVLR